MTRHDLLEAWHEHLALARRRSPHTVRAYLAAAERLLRENDRSDWTGIAAIEARDLRAHLAARRSEGIGNASAARELSALKAFITFAREQAGGEPGDAPRMRGPRLKKGLPRPVTPDDIANLTDLVELRGVEHCRSLGLLNAEGSRITVTPEGMAVLDAVLGEVVAAALVEA